MNHIQYEMISPVGRLYLIASDKVLQGIWYSKRSTPMVRTLQGGTAAQKILVETVRQLDEYFAGKRKAFDIALDPAGTNFQKNVWKQLSLIPYGKTVAYKDIAQRIKNPKAVRAVGTANGRNPFAIIIPCHRVIAADGTLGGYGGGITTKQKLLALEQK